MYPQPHTRTAALQDQHPAPSASSVTADEPTRTHRPPKSIVYIRVRCWSCAFWVFGQMYEDLCPHYNIIPSIPTALKIHRAAPVRPSPSSWPARSRVSAVVPFPECHVVGILQHVAFSGWLLSRSNLYLCFRLCFFMV